jgi:hypothetical protein
MTKANAGDDVRSSKFECCQEAGNGVASRSAMKQNFLRRQAIIDNAYLGIHEMTALASAWQNGASLCEFPN